MESQKKIVVAFIFMLVLAGAVVLWMLVLNKGTVSVHLHPPFSIQAGKQYQQCSENPCELKMNAYRYTLKVEKAGYFPFQEEIQLKRWQVIDVYPTLQFIPHLQEGETEYQKLPDDTPTEQPVLPFLDDNNPLAIGWDTDENIVFILPEEDRQKMYVWDRENEPKLITQFQNLKNPSISAGKNSVLVTDDENLFKIDVQKKRKELLRKDSAQAIEWNPSGTTALVEMQLKGLPLILLFSADEGKIGILPIQSSLARTVWLSDDEILFITFQELNDDLSASFQDIGLDADRLAGSEKEVLVDHLMKYNFRTGQFTDLIQIPSHVHLLEIEISQDRKELIGFTDQNTIRTIRLSE